MLHALPITNVRLRPCPVGAEQLTPVAGGHYCASCQRVVHDFTQASAAELTEAQAAAPDGRLCGRFRQSQLAARPQLRRRLRQFLLVAVLVLLRGFSAPQAWAQAQAPPDTVARTAEPALPREEIAGGVNWDEMPGNDSWGGISNVKKAPPRKPAAPRRRAATAHPAPAARRNRPH